MFENIIGNEQIREQLRKTVEQGKASHSYLFVGPEGIGKKLIAQEFATLILNKDIINNPDFDIIIPDGNSLKIEQIRELQKRIQEKPIASQKKVYIIDDAEKMTTESQNALLKTLEEPPEFATIILISSNENAFLATIKSRCMIIHFQKLNDNQIKNYMSNNYGLKNVNQNMLDIFQGSIKKAISLKDKIEQYKIIEDIVDSIEKQKDLIEISKIAEPLYKTKEEINEMLEYMNIIFIKKAKENYLYTKGIEIVENTKKRIRQNANYDMCIDFLIFNICTLGKE